MFHTSGVTERQLEIEPLLSKMSLDYDNKFDFVGHKHIEEISSIKKRLIKRLSNSIIYFLQALSIVVRSNHQTEVKRWTMQIRGHYAYRKISKKTMEIIAEALGLDANISISDLSSSRITVHYRLGDLLSLSEKSEIEFDRLFSAIQAELKRNHLITQLLILTDSLEACRARFKSMSLELEGLGIDTSIVSESSVNTIMSGVNAKCFIGTNSKISFWIVYFRSMLIPFAEENTSYIPIENINSINDVIEIENTRHQFLYF